MFPTLIRRTAQKAPPVNKAQIQMMMELHPARKIWPPDFKKLASQEQLRLEKKYKRRLARAMARPRWEKFVKLAQLFTFTTVVAYTFLFMDWGYETAQPFERLRESLRGLLGSYYGPPPSARPIKGFQPSEDPPQTK